MKNNDRVRAKCPKTLKPRLRLFDYVCIRFVVACFLMTTMMAGCLTAPKIERTRLYVLHPEISVNTAATLPITLGVRPLLAARPYGQSMAYLGNNQQIGYRVRDEWAELPASTVTRALTDALTATNRFKDVGNAADMARPDLLLTGELRMFHENRNLTPTAAELELRLELRPSRDPGAFWAQTLRETIPMQVDDASAFAEAMNEAIAKIVVQVAEAVSVVEPPVIPSADVPDSGATLRKSH